MIPQEKMDVSDLDTVQAVYDCLWRGAVGRLVRGQVEIDPFLQHPETDRRRGTTLVLRPSGEALERVTGLSDELRALEPDQYYLPAERSARDAALPGAGQG